MYKLMANHLTWIILIGEFTRDKEKTSNRYYQSVIKATDRTQ